MPDAEWTVRDKRTVVVFCDASKGAKEFNAAWEKQEVIERFLAFVGIIRDDDELFPKVINDLCTSGKSLAAEDYLITGLLMTHDPHERAEKTRWRDAERVSLSEALAFIYDRFNEYRNIKTAHGQWRPSGHRLWDVFNRSFDQEEFVAKVLSEIA